MSVESLERRMLLAVARGDLLLDINPGAASALSDGVNQSVAFNGKTYFAATQADTGTELWATDGTAAGTAMVADLATSAASSNPRDLVVSGGKLYFIADWAGDAYSPAAAPTRAKLFVSDGTTAGTHVVETPTPYYANYDPSNDLYGTVTEPAVGPTLVAYDGKIAFVANGNKPDYYVDNARTQFIWVSDGTTAGTRYLSVLGSSAGSSVLNLTPAGKNLYFSIHRDPEYDTVNPDAVGVYAGGANNWTSSFAMLYNAGPVQEIVATGSTAYVRTQGAAPYSGEVYQYTVNGVLSTNHGPYFGVSDLFTANNRVFLTGVDGYGGATVNQTLFELTPSGSSFAFQALTPFALPADQAAQFTPVGESVYFVRNDAVYYNSLSINRFDLTTNQFTPIRAGSDYGTSTFGQVTGVGNAVDAGPAFVKGPDGAVYFQGVTYQGSALYRIAGGAANATFNYYPTYVESYGQPIAIDPRPDTFMAVGNDWYAPGRTNTEGREWRLVQRPNGGISVKVFEATPGSTTPAYTLPAQSGVTPYIDTNANGRLDAGEPVAKTDPIYGTGYDFQITGLRTGRYNVRLALPTGAAFVSPATNAAVTVDVTEVPDTYYGQTNFTSASFVVRTPKNLTAALYEDTNGNNKRDYGEMPLAGRTVFLDTDNDGILDTGEPSLVTSSSGYATFSVYDGTYNIRQVLPSGWKATGAAVISGVVNRYDLYTDIGSQRVTTADTVITGKLFNDLNANGLLDGGEVVLAGRTVFDDSNNNRLLDSGEISTVTGSGGGYSLSLTASAAHTVRQVLPAGWEQTTPAGGAAFAVAAGAATSLTGRDFGSRPSALGPVDPDRVVLEGESAVFAGGTAAGNANGGYTGTGYADFAGQNSSAQWSIVRNTAGQVRLDFRYANGATSNRPLTVYANDVELGTFYCTPTGSWTAWSTVSVLVDFAVGTNTIKAVASTAAGGANVDSVTVVSPKAPPTPAWLSAAGGAAYTLADNTLTILAGTITFLGDAAATNNGLNVVARTGTRAVFNTTQHLGSLTLNGTATAALATPAAAKPAATKAAKPASKTATKVAAAAAAAAGGTGKVLRVTSLSIASGASLDLAGGNLVIDYTGASPLAAVRGLIVSGRGNGTWAGNGLRGPAANGPQTLGLMEAADYFAARGGPATFAGETVDSTAVLVRSTLAGDADLNGTVDFNDFLRLQNGFGSTSGTYAGGDFDYNGLVDFNDFLLLQNNFGVTG